MCGQKRGGGQGTNKCEGISIVQVRQRAYTEPSKARSPPATQECQGKVFASALVVGTGKELRITKDQHLCSKQQQTGARGQKKQREQALERTQRINLIAVPHFRGLGSLFVALEWDTI